MNSIVECYSLKNDLILYHITKEKYIQSILIEGLKINSKKSGFCRKDIHKHYKLKYGIQPIFLTNDVEYITKTMLTKEWINKHNAVVLKINNIKKNDVEHLQIHELIYFFDIKPENIKLVNVKLDNYF